MHASFTCMHHSGGAEDKHENEGFDGGECGASNEGQDSFEAQADGADLGPIMDSNSAFKREMKATFDVFQASFEKVHWLNICSCACWKEEAWQSN